MRSERREIILKNSFLIVAQMFLTVRVMLVNSQRVLPNGSAAGWVTQSSPAF